MADQYDLTPHERVEIVSREPSALVAIASYGSGGSAPPNHLHPAQDERFEVLAGTLTVDRDGAQETLSVGAEITVARGTPHRMWNADPATEARVRWTTTPAGRTEDWWRALADARAGRDRPPPHRALPLLREYRDVFRLVAPGPAAPVVGAVLGYRRG